MTNRAYTDFAELRRVTVELIDAGRVRVHKHAQESHPELSEVEQIAVVRYGSQPRLDRKRDPSAGVYVCWAQLPGRGLCRGVFCIEQTGARDVVLVSTAFVE
jgi:hypothetical protein